MFGIGLLLFSVSLTTLFLDVHYCAEFNELNDDSSIMVVMLDFISKFYVMDFDFDSGTQNLDRTYNVALSVCFL